MPTRIVLLDEGGRIVEGNASWRRLTSEHGCEGGYVGWSYLDAWELTTDASQVEVAAGLRQVRAGELEVFEFTYPSQTPEGCLWYLLRAVPYIGGQDGWIVVTHQDVTEVHRHREHIRHHEAILDQLDAAVYTTDLHRTVQSWNAGAERLFGWTAEEAIGRSTYDMMLGRLERPAPSVHTAVEQGRWAGELELSRKDGSTFPAYVRTSNSPGLVDESVLIAYVVLDISERVQSQRELTATRDRLRAVADSIGEGMFTLDLEGRLTYMNPAAEQALGLALEDVRDTVAQDLLQSRHLNESAKSAQAKHASGAGHGDNVVRVRDDTFLRGDGVERSVAYTASPYATEDGVEGIVVVFRDITERKAETRRLTQEVEKARWVKRIKRALADDQFVLFAQPIVALDSNEVVQRELLIRLRDPKAHDKVIAPGEFLPVAEEYGLIGDIDRWVIDQSTRLAASGLAVELNVSAASIGDRRLIPFIKSAIGRNSADPALLVFEITETSLLGNEQDGQRFVDQMRQLGCRVALDDFGTGYGGFTYLKQLPVDYLKIDIEFVRDLATNEASRNVVEAIVTLASRFGLKTIAEGVESSESLLLLRDLSVDYAQGYYIGRPAPLEA